MFAILDIETTGLSPVHNRILEIAIYRYDGKEIVDEFSAVINPERRILPYIQQLTGITNQAVQDAPKFYDIGKRIVEITRDATIVAHNVRFDYAFLRNEFRNLGYHYHRRQLCTIKLARKLIPGLPSYKLGLLCQSLNIEHSDKHRAFGDAQATLALFKQLQALEHDPLPSEPFRAETRNPSLPPTISRDQITALPEDTGIYYFYNARNRLIYVGKSINIRRRVLDHFSNDLQSSKSRRIKEELHSIKYERTGSELIALLLESDIIKTRQPVFNRSQRNVRYRYGIFVSRDAGGYQRFTIRVLAEAAEDAILSFTSRYDADAFLNRMINDYQLCQKLCGIHNTRSACFRYYTRQCKGACIGNEAPAIYNRRVRKALHRFDYPHQNFLIIGKGRSKDESSVVSIENGLYKGFGFYAPKHTGDDPTEIKKAIIQKPENQDVRRIINGFLRKNARDSLIAY